MDNTFFKEKIEEVLSDKNVVEIYKVSNYFNEKVINTTKHFYFLRGKKSTQQRINKKLLEFEHPELLEKYTKSEEVEEKVEFK